MSILKKTLFGCCALVLVTGAFGQLTRDNGKNLGKGSTVGNGGVGAQACKEGTVKIIEVPNLIWAKGAVTDPADGKVKTGFRPEVINLDGWTLRDVIQEAGTVIDCDGYTLIVQTVRVKKETPVIKCTAFKDGPGAGLNTNFDTGLKFATNQNLDDPICNVAFGLAKDADCLGNRCLLFSPPYTKYTMSVTYVRRDNATGRPGAPITVSVCYQVANPTRDDIRCNIEYFGTVAAGVTQKCKITEDVADALNACLDIPDGLEALLCFETVVGTFSIDFSVLRDAKNGAGQYDARFIGHYLIDSDEEPIGCLLDEMALASLWHP